MPWCCRPLLKSAFKSNYKTNTFIEKSCKAEKSVNKTKMTANPNILETQVSSPGVSCPCRQDTHTLATQQGSTCTTNTAGLPRPAGLTSCVSRNSLIGIAAACSMGMSGETATLIIISAFFWKNYIWDQF